MSIGTIDPSKKIVMCAAMEVGANMLEYLHNEGIRISSLVTLRPDQAEKYKVSSYCPFEPVAEKLKIPVHYPKTYALSAQEDFQYFLEQDFDLMIIGGWQRLIPERILESITYGAVGVHGSSEFLPKGRGRSPINWSLIEGKSRFIIHLFSLKPEVDDGDIIDYEMFDINDWDTCRTLYYKNAIATKRMLVRNIPKILQGEASSTPQKGEPTHYPKRTAEDGIIDWSKSVFEIYNFVRAITKPYPGAFSFVGDKRVNIWQAQPFDTRLAYLGAREGEVVEVFSTGDCVVNCNGGLLLVIEYEGELKRGDILHSPAA